MRVETKAEVVSTLERAKGELQARARIIEAEIGLVARAFEGHREMQAKIAEVGSSGGVLEACAWSAKLRRELKVTELARDGA